MKKLLLFFGLAGLTGVVTAAPPQPGRAPGRAPAPAVRKPAAPAHKHVAPPPAVRHHHKHVVPPPPPPKPHHHKHVAPPPKPWWRFW